MELPNVVVDKCRSEGVTHPFIKTAQEVCPVCQSWLHLYVSPHWEGPLPTQCTKLIAENPMPVKTEMENG